MKTKKNESNSRPKYNKLYTDIIRDKYPEKENLCRAYLEKENWNALDVIYVNELLFGKTQNTSMVITNQKHRAYDQESIMEILQDQIRNRLNNTQLANKYKLSRNTVQKWQRHFGSELIKEG